MIAMSKVATWALFLVLGIVLIDVGIQGKLGSLLGAVITPSQLHNSSGSENAQLPGESNG
jgi:hypothetical protein